MIFLSRKILDANVVITFLKDIVSCNTLKICGGYDILISNHVRGEITKPLPLVDSLKVIHLDSAEALVLFSDISRTFLNLGEGEILAFTLAVILNEKGGKTVFVTDDGVAFSNLQKYRKQKWVREKYPRICDVVFARPVNVFRHLFAKGMLDELTLKLIVSDLSPTGINKLSELRGLFE